MAVLSLTWKSPYVDKTVFILRRGPGDFHDKELWWQGDHIYTSDTKIHLSWCPFNSFSRPTTTGICQGNPLVTIKDPPPPCKKQLMKRLSMILRHHQCKNMIWNSKDLIDTIWPNLLLLSRKKSPTYPNVLCLGSFFHCSMLAVRQILYHRWNILIFDVSMLKLVPYHRH